jgi:hypothetical protein
MGWKQAVFLNNNDWTAPAIINLLIDEVEGWYDDVYVYKQEDGGFPIILGFMRKCGIIRNTW